MQIEMDEQAQRHSEEQGNMLLKLENLEAEHVQQCFSRDNIKDSRNDELDKLKKDTIKYENGKYKYKSQLKQLKKESKETLDEKEKEISVLKDMIKGLNKKHSQDTKDEKDNEISVLKSVIQELDKRLNIFKSGILKLDKCYK